MSIQEISVQLNESVHLSQTLTLDGVRFRLDTYTNKADSSWYMDLADEDGVALVQGIALVVGLDLLYPYRHLTNIPPGILFVNDQTLPVLSDPMLDSFTDQEFALYYQTVEDA